MAEKKESRRSFLSKLTGTLLGIGLFSQAIAYIRSLVPNVLYEPPQKFKIGKPSDLTKGVKFIEDRRLYIFREKGAFYAISGVCTHLGCTVKYSPYSKPVEVTIKGEEKTINWEFRCPCHGSVFLGDGTNSEGPAPKPLKWHPLEISPDDGQLVVDLSKEVEKDFRLVV